MRGETEQTPVLVDSTEGIAVNGVAVGSGAALTVGSSEARRNRTNTDGG